VARAAAAAAPAPAAAAEAGAVAAEASAEAAAADLAAADKLRVWQMPPCGAARQKVSIARWFRKAMRSTDVTRFGNCRIRRFPNFY
ncbi:MAG: hypothetical protein LIO54_06840, partial [Oscillospiraceae bacterium]|nr:hypothetical protein [Oscillospiraceae bacterium]